MSTTVQGAIGDEARSHLNGVDTTILFATIEAVRQQPEAAKFRFRAVNDWVSGTHSRGRFPGSSAPARSTSTRTPPSSMPTTRRCSWAPTRSDPRGVAAQRLGVLSDVPAWATSQPRAASS